MMNKRSYLLIVAMLTTVSVAYAEEADGDCATIGEQIMRHEARIAEYEKAIEEEGFADESPDEMYRSGVEQAHELVKALNRARAELVEAERALAEIGESAYLRDVVDELRIEERVLQRHVERLNEDLGLVRTIVAMQREVKVQRQRLAAYIARAEETGCDLAVHPCACQ